ncbi:MAG: TrmH family RNA methyltransferase [Chloroflexota bacterium]
MSSSANPRVKLLRSLAVRKQRRAQGLCLAEGVRLVEEGLASGLAVHPLVYNPERLSTTAAGRALRNRLERQGLGEEIDERILDTLTDTMTSQGVLAAVETPEASPMPDDGLVLILDGIADPGNAGTMVRTARAAGAVGVVATQATTDLWAPKAMRGGMGAHFHLPLRVDVPWAEMPLAIGGRPLRLAAARQGKAYWQLDWLSPVALIVGSEAHGGTAQAMQRASEAVHIPMAGGAESLNAAAAAAVLLFHAQFQRQCQVSDT